MMYWLILLGIPLILGLYAQIKVSSAYQKNSQIGSRGRITGREAAEAVMSSAGIRDVEIVEVEGMLTDHYDPVNKRLALSAHNYRGDSLAALGVAAFGAFARMSVRHMTVIMAAPMPLPETSAITMPDLPSGSFK